MFANDKELKKLFKGHTDCPEFDCYDSRSYIGIWSPGKSPWVYAGFGVMPTGLGVLWVGLMVPGRHAAKAKKVPKQLTSRFNAATQFLNTKEDFSANQGLTAEDGNTHFEFAQPITPAFDGQSEKILEWFKATIMDARAFVTKHCK